jgi:hypothetical protein
MIPIGNGQSSFPDPAVLFKLLIFIGIPHALHSKVSYLKTYILIQHMYQFIDIIIPYFVLFKCMRSRLRAYIQSACHT